MQDAREELAEKLTMAYTSAGETTDFRSAVYIILDKYEIQSRCTEIALTDEDRNKQLVGRFLIAKTVKGCTANTIEQYKREIPQALERIGKTVDDITADDIRLWMARRMKVDKVSKTTADNELRYLRSFYTWMSAEEIITKNPMLKVEKIKKPKRKAEVFTEVEIERLRDAATDEREKALIELLLSTGCRVTEISQIRKDEIEGGKILIHGKGDKDRYVYANAKAQVAMDKYLSKRKDENPYLFAGGFRNLSETCRVKRSWWKDKDLVTPDKHIDHGTIEQITRRIGKRAGVGRANPHKFRKTCATMALRHGMPIEQVSKMLGHEQLSTTQIYLNMDEETLEQAHKKYVI